MSKLERVCEKLGVKISCEYGAAPYNENFRSAHRYKVRLRLEKRSLTANFYMGPAHTKEPSAADVLSSLVLDTTAGEQDFEEFCSEFGYDSDSIKARNTWKACARMAPKVRRFLGDHFDAVASAEH